MVECVYAYRGTCPQKRGPVLAHFATEKCVLKKLVRRAVINMYILQERHVYSELAHRAVIYIYI